MRCSEPGWADLGSTLKSQAHAHAHPGEQTPLPLPAKAILTRPMSSTPEVPVLNPPISTEEQAAADLLSTQDIELIDACILSHCADHFYKVARIMGRTEDELANRFPKLSFVFYTQRLKQLVDTGRLDAAGDVFKMRFSEVRLLHQTTS